MWKKFLLVIIVPFLIISWSLIYVANGVTSVFVWWCIQAFSVISVFLLIGSVIMFFLNGIFRKRIDRTLLLIILFSIIGAWPVGWFANIGRIAYPADI